MLGNLLELLATDPTPPGRGARFELRPPMTESSRTARPTPGHRSAPPDAPAEGLANAAVSR